MEYCLLHDGLCFGDLVLLTRSETCIKREALAVSQEVDLGREATGPEGVVVWFFSGVKDPFFRAPAAAQWARTTVRSRPHGS